MRNFPISWIRYGLGWRGLKAFAIILMILPFTARAETIPRVLALGDSLTAGYGLPRDQGLVPRLQDWLNRNGVRAQMINAGVSGDTTTGGRARLGWLLGQQDVDALIVTLGGNDILRGVDPALARANLDAILASAAEARLPVLLIGLATSRNYGAAYKAAFDAIYPELAAQYGTLYVPNFFAPLGAGSSDPSHYLRYMQADGIHPNAAGVDLLADALGPRVAELVALVP